jgi:hypothetical protein
VPMSNVLSFKKPKREFNNPVSPPAARPAFIPAPPTNNVNLNLPLDIFLPGASEKIAKSKTMVFHAVGDTGGIHGTETQDGLAAIMVAQIEESRVKKKSTDEPLFFYHLGDVVYFNGLIRDYPVQFYEPYQNYDAPIVAIAGNHDGAGHAQTGDTADEESTLFGFLKNFCAPTSEYLFKHRPTMTQPYVYWSLDTPLAMIIGLYSNVDGQLDAPGTFEQQHWLIKQLTDAPSDRALIVTVHHAPYSLDTAHGGYGDIGAAIDRASNVSGRTPDLILSGHVHNYQRFSRKISNKAVPYVVAGAGGYANELRALHEVGQDLDTGKKPQAPFQTTLSDVTLEAYNDTQPGFLRIKITETGIDGDYYTMSFDDVAQGVSDRFSVALSRK